MAAKKPTNTKETTYLAFKDATELWAFVRSEMRFKRKLTKTPDTGASYPKRLLYLMAVAVFRTVEHLVEEPRWRNVLNAAESYADGQLTSSKFFAAFENGSIATHTLPAASAAAADCTHMIPDDYKVLEGVDYVTDAMGYLGAVAAGLLKPDTPLGTKSRAVWRSAPFQEAKRAHERTLCGIIRDIFGNPFRPVPFDTAWRTDTAMSLAQSMYESRDFSAMPILADALQDAGCDNDDILNHCREPGTHVRGCWVVDWVLNKK